MEREELEYQLGRNRASIQEIKSERDRGKIADYDYKLLLEVALSEERFLSAVKARLDLVDKVAQLKKELSSTDIDSALPVTVFEEETSSYKVLSPRQYKELELRSAMFYMPGLDAEIPRHGHEYVRLYKLALRVLPGFKPDEIQKKLAAESVQMDNHVSTSTAASVAQSAADKAATEPEPEQTKPKPVGPPVEMPAFGSPPVNKVVAEAPVEASQASPATRSRREMINLKLEEIERVTLRQLKRRDFARAAGYSVRNLQLFQQGKCTPDVETAFNRLLKDPPTTIVEILDKKTHH